MKLSEAIRLGATLKPQAFSQWEIDSSCALAAAAEALSIPRTLVNNLLHINYRAIQEAFPATCNQLRFAACPQCGSTCADYSSPLAIVYHLNDSHKWSREQIADFVELHEGMPEPTVEVTRCKDCGTNGDHYCPAEVAVD